MGLGVLLVEPQLCHDLNLEYFSVPVEDNAGIMLRVDAVRAALAIASKPVLLHCCSRRRVDKLAVALGLKLSSPNQQK
jgi:protein tyrosine phosphatase (PTP) superfamily phosphohydrolase (DUF442 family)